MPLDSKGKRWRISLHYVASGRAARIGEGLNPVTTGSLGISRHLLGTTHEVDDRHDHQDDNECSKTDVHRNLLSWIATVGDHPAADYIG